MLENKNVVTCERGGRVIRVLSLGRMTKILPLVAALIAALAVADGAAAASYGSDAQQQLAQARQATAKFHDGDAAIAAGYVPSECFEVPGLGGMGNHYVNFTLLADPAIDATRPEVLLYAPLSDGSPRLVGVEYVKVDADQNLATDDDRPYLFGIPFDGPMEGHFPGMPIHYDLHVWIWQANQRGLFAQFNPNIHC